MAGYAMHKPDLAKRLARIEGQVRGVARMVDDDRYCVEVLDQIAAITKALQQVALGLLHEHVAHCVVDAARSGDPSDKIDEASAAIGRLLRA